MAGWAPEGWMNVRAPEGYFSRVPREDFETYRKRGWTEWSGAVPEDQKRRDPAGVHDAQAQAPTPAVPSQPSSGSLPASRVFRGRALEIGEAAAAEGLIAEASVEAVADSRIEALTSLTNVGERTAANLIAEVRRAVGRG